MYMEDPIMIAEFTIYLEQNYCIGNIHKLNIARVRNCPDVTILNSLFDLSGWMDGCLLRFMGLGPSLWIVHWPLSVHLVTTKRLRGE